MSILIKGMEMPVNCFLCPLSVLNGERLYCEVTKGEVLRAKKPSDCPLVALPSAQPEPTLYGYPIEHLAMIARVMAKENCTPEIVAQMLQNAGEIAKMVRDEMMEMLKESIERICKGVAND